MTEGEWTAYGIFMALICLWAARAIWLVVTGRVTGWEQDELGRIQKSTADIQAHLTGKPEGAEKETSNG